MWNEFRSVVVAGAVVIGVACGGARAQKASPGGVAGAGDVTTPYVALAFNDLGMHCMNPDYSELMVLPPFNNLHVQVIRRGAEPEIISSGVTVRYSIPSNTHSSDKSNFWRYPQALLGSPAPDVGLTGYGLLGTMAPMAANDWAATGIPIVPIDDNGRENPYPLAVVSVERNGLVVAQTRAVVPTSTEMNCQLCHHAPGVSTAQDILAAHDRLHGTTLVNQKPVLCAGCHSDNALGLPGQAGVSTLSSAMHTAHAPRMGQIGLAVDCYACHPGVRTTCLRDTHAASGTTCTDCHGTMVTVGNPARRPWIDLPTCGGCHTRAGFEFEQPGALFKTSVGHGGVHCAACHNSPHVITPATSPIDNVQANLLQGHSGTIDTCLVCHTSQPTESFFHKVSN